MEAHPYGTMTSTRFHFLQLTWRSGIAPEDVVIFPQQLRTDFPDAIHGYLGVI
jgi:hypothetical protein